MIKLFKPESDNYLFNFNGTIYRPFNDEKRIDQYRSYVSENMDKMYFRTIRDKRNKTDITLLPESSVALIKSQKGNYYCELECDLQLPYLGRINGKFVCQD